MDHFPRFRRKKDLATPTIITPGNGAETAGNTTPPPGEPQPVVPARPSQKLSPFRVFHRSGKRSRDSPPASLPRPPVAAAVSASEAVANHPVSPLSIRTDAVSEHAVGEHESKTKRPPKIPAFLELTPHDIENKFQELVWLERERIMMGMQNPSPDFRWARVAGPHLRALDRYMNIQPWHNNRVKLQVPEGHVDYINASPIALESSSLCAADSHSSGSREADRYIAMQGPKQTSTDHVWRMVVEQLESPGVIVMLTETHEGPAEKCYPYFPRSETDPPIEINERDEFGDGFRATVRCEGIEETTAGDAIELRKMVVRVHARGRGARDDEATSPTSTTHVNTPPSQSSGDQSFEEERVVWHFLYKKWPDFGVPALADLDSFFTLMRLSREKNAAPHNPRIVHCSAGVGRSGTFIALEHLIRELDAGVLEHYDERAATPSPVSQHRPDGSSSPATVKEEEGEDLIFSVVNQLREQRRTMVQAESQYLFIYQVLRKLWQDKYGSDEMGEPAAKRLEVDPFVEG
ncbi:protein-tyrosine phosphatase-like protein [Bombardia bombarda]|uniref:Protein-tyrosine phosphatase-like protein n=1 Tax=Bombardia bombarda TaxID=252184 RepID=A0AA39X0X8_9PEZI|nr:protein-tyrosine phosphatase-like protein [Bombardia bombarda]